MALTGQISSAKKLQGSLHSKGYLTGHAEQKSAMTGTLSVGIPSYDYYTGSYEFTPTQTTQTVSINGKTATADITINPIPSNYGLITWDGSALTVS